MKLRLTILGWLRLEFKIIVSEKPMVVSSHRNSLSYPGNLAKSNSEDLWTSLVSTPELHSNKSLCQESDILLIH